MKSKTLKIIILITTLTGLAYGGKVGLDLYTLVQNTKSADPLVWEDSIQAFEKEDRRRAIKTGGILFVGSSSINYWKTLKEDMAPLPVLNRGFGGAKIKDVIYFAKRFIIPHKPGIIVFYCGDNDLSMGRVITPEQTFQAYKRFIALLKAELPETRVYYVSIKPSPRRYKYWPAMQTTNQLIRKYSEQTTGLEFIDISSSMLNTQARPKQKLYIWDGTHMNPKGYELWTSIIKPVITAAYKARR